MKIDLTLHHRQGAFELDAQFCVEGGLIALFGPSGAGKTSILNAIAGLTKPDQGRITLDGEPILDTARRIDLAPHRRRLAVIFQDNRLFPHLSVKQNLLYGRFFARSAPEVLEFDRVIALLGIEKLLARKPKHLSGGEKQRVALGRALLSAPRLLLMDEPLAALDEARKQEIIPYLERLRDDFKLPMIMVSHAIADVTRLAQKIVLINAGRVIAVGETSELMQRLDLTDMTGAEEAGALIDARVESIDREFGLALLRSKASVWRVAHLDAEPGARVRLRIRARDVLLTKTVPPDISALNIMPAVVAAIHDKGEGIVEIKLDCGGEGLIARLTRYSLQKLQLQEGSPVFAIIKSVAFDSTSHSTAPENGGAA